MASFQHPTINQGMWHDKKLGLGSLLTLKLNKLLSIDLVMWFLNKYDLVTDLDSNVVSIKHVIRCLSMHWCLLYANKMVVPI
jgi:hypothetical protein